jgi:hypothetical protein
MNRKLYHYFNAHTITVGSSFPFREVLQNWDATGRITKWAHELMDKGLMVAPKMAIKSQVLADFITEWTEGQRHRWLPTKCTR